MRYVISSLKLSLLMIVRLIILGIKHAKLEHFRIDAEHSNAFAAWKATGSPQVPTAAQYQQLESAGQLELLDAPKRIGIEHGTMRLQFELPRQGLSLLRIRW